MESEPPVEPDPRDLLVPYPEEPMTLWPLSLRVNSVANDDASILVSRIDGAAGWCVCRAH
jgi:putative SOS response-associated peptidase YedK